MGKNLYDKLGVNKDATDEEIKKAYRKKAKENHPDKGGSQEKMTDLTVCYSILSSKDKRKRYDETGKEEGASAFQTRFLGFVNQIFIGIVESSQNPYGIDIIDLFKIQVRNMIISAENSVTEDGYKKARYENILKRISSTGDDAIMITMNTKIESYMHNANQMKEEIEFLKQAIVIINHYNYDYDKPAVQPRGISVSSW